MKKTSVARLYNKDHKWLMNNRDAKKRSVADVVHGLIDFHEVCTNPSEEDCAVVRKPRRT